MTFSFSLFMIPFRVHAMQMNLTVVDDANKDE